MRRTITILSILFLGAVLISNVSNLHDVYAQKGQAAGGRLPNYWTKLGLSKDQRLQVYQIQSDYRKKVEDLEKQIQQVRREEKSKLLTVLTDAQKSRLREIYLRKAGFDPADLEPGSSKK